MSRIFAGEDIKRIEHLLGKSDGQKWIGIQNPNDPRNRQAEHPQKIGRERHQRRRMTHKRLEAPDDKEEK